MTTLSDISTLLAEDAQLENSAFLDVTSRYGRGVVDLLSDRGYLAGEQLQLLIQVARDAAESYVEGQALPSPVEGTYVRAEFDWVSFRAVIRESGHERRAHGPGDVGMSIPDPGRKMRDAAEAIAYQIATYFDGAADGQLLGLIDDTTAFGGQNRAVYTALKSYVLAAGGAAISRSLISQGLSELADLPYSGRAMVALASSTQVRKLRDLISGDHAPTTMAGPQALVPAGVELEPGVPVIQVPNLATDTIVMLSDLPSWGVWSHEPNPGGFHVLDLGAANSDTPLNLQISTSLAIATEQPQRQGKIEGLST